METFKNAAKNKKLNLTPSVLGFTKQDFEGKCVEKGLNEFFFPLLVNSPTKHSQWFFDIDKLQINNEDEIVNTLLNLLGLTSQSLFVFERYASDASTAIDIMSQVQAFEGRKLICRVNSKYVIDDIYKGIRNSFAHGGFCRKNGKFIFYALRLDSSQTNQFDKGISFYLELEDLAQLKGFVEVIDILNNIVQ